MGMNTIFRLLILLVISNTAYAQASKRSLGLSKMYFEVDRYTGTQYEPYLDFENFSEDVI